MDLRRALQPLPDPFELIHWIGAVHGAQQLIANYTIKLHFVGTRPILDPARLTQITSCGGLWQVSVAERCI